MPDLIIKFLQPSHLSINDNIENQIKKTIGIGTGMPTARIY